MDWSPPCIGVLNKDGSRSDQKGDFAIQLDTLVQADANTGYLATVKGELMREKGKTSISICSIQLSS